MKEEKDACGAARLVRDDFFVEVEAVAFDTNIEPPRTPVLGELTGGSYYLYGG